MTIIKLIFSLLLTFVSLTSSNNVKRIDREKFSFTGEEIYGPFSSEDEDVTLSFSYYVPTSKRNLIVKEKLEVYKDSVIVTNLSYIYETKGHHNRNKTNHVFDVEFKPSVAFGNMNYSILVFTLYNSSTGLNYLTKTVNLLKENSRYYDESSLGSKETIKNQMISLKDDSDNVGESFDFTNFPSYFSKGTYHNLSIKELRIGYDFATNITQTRGILYFDDPFNLFKNFREYSVDHKYFELDLIFEDGYIYWTPKSLFVDPNTLAMSDVRLNGFTPTDYFFFPYETYGLFSEMTFTLYIEGLGLSKSTLEIDVIFYPTNTLLGDCSNSEYCIIGGVNNG